MTKCEYCGKEIGLLAVRYTWLDKENKRAVHDTCLEKYTRENQGKIPQKKVHQQFQENTIGVLNFLTLHGLIDQQYNLIFTKEKLIGQYIGGNTVAFLAGGFLGMTIADSVHKKKATDMMVGTDPEAILAEHKKNFAVEYASIDEIQLKGRKLKISLNQKQKTIGNKLSFIFPSDQYNNIEAILMKIVPDKIITNY